MWVLSRIPKMTLINNGTYCNVFVQCSNGNPRGRKYSKRQVDPWNPIARQWLRMDKRMNEWMNSWNASTSSVNDVRCSRLPQLRDRARTCNTSLHYCHQSLSLDPRNSAYPQIQHRISISRLLEFASLLSWIAYLFQYRNP